MPDSREDQLEWQKHAKCGQRDVIAENLRYVLPPEPDQPQREAESITELFFPPRDRALYKPVADVAKAICRGHDGRPPCPVRKQCLWAAVERGELFGIFGGLSHRERNALIRKLDRVNMPLVIFLTTGGPS